MDTRLYILGAAFLLFVASLAYFVSVLRAARRDRTVGESVFEEQSETERRRARRALQQPLKTGAWRPDAPEPAQPEGLPAIIDSLSAEDEPAPPPPVAVPVPFVPAVPPPPEEPAPLPPSAILVEPSPVAIPVEPTPVAVPQPAPAVEPAPVARPVPVPEPTPPVPVIPDVRVVAPAPAEEPVATPAPVEMPDPVVPLLPVVPLVEPEPSRLSELEAIQADLASLLETPEPDAAPPVPAAEPEVQEEGPLGWMLSLAASLGEPASQLAQPLEPPVASPGEPPFLGVASAPSAPAPSATGAAAPAPTRASRLRDGEYAMVAPVEMHFADRGKLVGVREGTKTFAEFQRAAANLLAELKRVSPPQG